jgi:protein-tyrosine phosphatase
MMNVMSQRAQKVLMVCMGNICRSPLAECVFRHKARQRGMEDVFHVDSAGTGGWHAGEPPDPRVRRIAAGRGIELTGMARQISPEDFTHFDHIICMDEENRERVLHMGAPPEKVRLLLDALPAEPVREVPDPYYGCLDGFEEVFRLVDDACEALLNEMLSVKP